jgi:hypothetical protein
MYAKTAFDFHLPCDIIFQRGVPPLAAAVAAPLRKLCEEKESPFLPSDAHASLTIREIEPLTISQKNLSFAEIPGTPDLAE